MKCLVNDIIIFIIQATNQNRFAILIADKYAVSAVYRITYNYNPVGIIARQS